MSVCRITLVVLVAVVALPGFAAAQEDEPEAAAGQEETKPVVEEAIVVIGDLVGSGLTRAASTLSAEDIEERPFGAEVTQSLAKIPGVQVSTGDTRGGSFSYEIYLRGLTDEQVGFSVDGIPTGDTRFNGGQPPNRFLEASNVAKVVVSQSSGDIGSPSRFALGGFVNFETVDPESDAGVDIESGYGEFGYWRLFARADFGDFGAGWTGYVSASTQTHEIFTGRRNRSADREHAELKLRRQGERSTVRFRVSYNDRDDNDFNIITLDEYRDDPRSDRATDALTGIPNVDADFGGALGGLREDLLAYVNGDFQLTDRLFLQVNPYVHSLRGESLRYQNRQRDLEGDDPRAVLGYDENGGAIRPSVLQARDGNAVGGPADLRITPRDRDRVGLTSELLIDGSDRAGDLRVGLWRENNEATEFRNFYPILNPGRSIAVDRNDLRYVEYERTANVDTTMLYIQDEWSLLDDRLTVDVGLTHHRIDYQAESPLEYRVAVDESQSSGLNPKVGFSLELTDAAELFAGYAQNFAGIPEDTFLGSTAAIDVDELEPVETENFDVGLRFVGDDWAFLVQGYVVDLENLIGIVPRDPGDPEDVDDIVRGNVATKAGNIGGGETVGIEVSGFRDFGMADAYLSYAWQDATHKGAANDVERLSLAAQGVIGGERIRDIPEHALYAEIGLEPGERLRLQATAKYVGERVGAHLIVPDFCNRFFCFDESGAGVDALQALGIETLDEHILLGLHARYDFQARSVLEGLSLQLNLDNLLDEEYVSAVSGATATLPEFGAVGGAGRTLDRYFIGAPRTVTLSARFEF